MMARKREALEAFGELECLKESPNAKVQGILRGLSDMKKGGSTSYWDGELWDESGLKRVYGFDGGVRRKLWEFQEKGEAVDLAS